MTFGRRLIFLFAVLLSSVGAAQGVSWSQVADAGPPAQWHHALAYDTQRQRTVLFGVDGATWEWNGSTWALMAVTGPSPRTCHAMAYDSLRHRTILFGGQDQATLRVFGDTWGWDGTSWTELADAGPGWWCHGMAYDSARSRMVAFGGGDNTTWEWDGVAWNQVADGGPEARGLPALSYDSNRARTVLFGGQDVSSSPLGDTWEWDGVAWTQVAGTRTWPFGPGPDGGPTARSGHAVAYDSARERTVLFGGRDDLGNRLGDTWEWDGCTWTSALVDGGPAGRVALAMAYDSARSRVVLFGGYGATNILADTWEYRADASSGDAGSHTCFIQARPGDSGAGDAGPDGGLPPVVHGPPSCGCGPGAAGNSFHWPIAFAVIFLALAHRGKGTTFASTSKPLSQ